MGKRRRREPSPAPSGNARIRWALARRPRPRRPRLALFCFPAALFIGWWAFPVRPGIVLGESMAPSFRDRQVFLMSTRWGGRGLARGDVVVFRLAGTTYIKRVRGLPGERIWGLVCDEVQGRPAYLASTEAEVGRMRRAAHRAPAVGQLVHVEVPRGSVFVVGDAAGASYDSRHFGPVPMDAITGRVIVGSLLKLPSSRRGGGKEVLASGPAPARRWVTAGHGSRRRQPAP